MTNEDHRAKPEDRSAFTPEVRDRLRIIVEQDSASDRLTDRLDAAAAAAALSHIDALEARVAVLEPTGNPNAANCDGLPNTPHAPIAIIMGQPCPACVALARVAVLAAECGFDRFTATVDALAFARAEARREAFSEAAEMCHAASLGGYTEWFDGCAEMAAALLAKANTEAPHD